MENKSAITGAENVGEFPSISPEVMHFCKRYNYAYGHACETYRNVPLGAVQDVLRSSNFSMTILPQAFNELLDLLYACPDIRVSYPELFEEEQFDIK